MTSEERQLIRGMIDAKKRDQLHNQEARLHPKKPGPRAPYWRAFYAKNREKILAQRRARRLKDAT